MELCQSIGSKKTCHWQFNDFLQFNPKVWFFLCLNPQKNGKDIGSIKKGYWFEKKRSNFKDIDDVRLAVIHGATQN